MPCEGEGVVYTCMTARREITSSAPLIINKPSSFTAAAPPNAVFITFKSSRSLLAQITSTSVGVSIPYSPLPWPFVADIRKSFLKILRALDWFFFNFSFSTLFKLFLFWNSISSDSTHALAAASSSALRLESASLAFLSASLRSFFRSFSACIRGSLRSANVTYKVLYIVYVYSMCLYCI